MSFFNRLPLQVASIAKKFILIIGVTSFIIFFTLGMWNLFTLAPTFGAVWIGIAIGSFVSFFYKYRQMIKIEKNIKTNLSKKHSPEEDLQETHIDIINP
jgi:hypothetical protein